ncbi:MAG: hypothetical protein ACRCTI_08980, partial [Beijerinckiaceae bacterium]
ARIKAALRIIDDAERRAKDIAGGRYPDGFAEFDRFVGNARRALPKLRDELRSRDKPLADGPLKQVVTLVIEGAPEQVGPAEPPASPAVEVSAGFVPLLCELAAWPVAEAPAALVAMRNADRQGRPFGELVFSEFTEILKGDDYPEARHAFQIHIWNELEHAVAAIDGSLAANWPKLDAALAGIAALDAKVTEGFASLAARLDKTDELNDLKLRWSLTDAALTALFRNLKEDRPDDATLMERLLMLAGQLGQSRAYLARPDNLGGEIPALKRRGLAALDAGDLDIADALLKQVSEEEKAILARRRREREEAVEAEQAAAKDMADTLFARMRLALARRDDAEAAEHVREALRVLEEASSGALARMAHDAGVELYEHGIQFPGLAALDLAVAAFERAIRATSREASPVSWAAMQDNLGNARQTLGARLGGEAGAAQLAEAIAAYDLALNIRTREAMAADWAGTQNNRGNALARLGERLGGEAGAGRLADSVAAYDLALSVRTREAMPEDWAITQSNRGNTLRTLGERLGGETGLACLENSVAAYDQALSIQTCEAMPTHWAMTQNNLGNALSRLGARLEGEAGVARLVAAVAAYDLALNVRTREASPADWAMTHNNRGTALQMLGERLRGKAGIAQLAESVAAYDLALCVRTRDALPVAWAMTQNNRGNVLRTLGEIIGGEAGAAHLADSIAAYNLALCIHTREALSAAWAMTNENLAGAELAIFAAIGDKNALLRALTAVDQALEVYREGGMDYDVGTAERLRADILAAMNAAPPPTA